MYLGKDFGIVVMSNDTRIENVSVTYNDTTKLTDIDGYVNFSAPDEFPDGNNTLKILVDKEGYKSKIVYIENLSMPKLIIIICQQYYDQSVYGSPVLITISDNQGDLIDGAFVTVTDQIYITENGKAEIDVSKSGNITITANHSGYIDAESVTINVQVHQSELEIFLIYFVIIPVFLIMVIIVFVVFIYKSYIKHK